MPSQFEADFDAAFTSPGLDVFGETIAYTPNGGSVRNISAVVARETRAPVYNETGRNFYNTMEIHISADDDVSGVVTPKELRNGGDADTCVIDGQTWLLQRVLERNVAGMHHLLLFDEGIAGE